MIPTVNSEIASRRIGLRRNMVLLIAGSALTGACVTVNAPDKPIEINLNIKISQEVVYRFDGDAKQLIEDNPGIF